MGVGWKSTTLAIFRAVEEVRCDRRRSLGVAEVKKKEFWVRGVLRRFLSVLVRAFYVWKIGWKFK
jgi:hypothetical protein